MNNFCCRILPKTSFSLTTRPTLLSTAPIQILFIPCRPTSEMERTDWQPSGSASMNTQVFQGNQICAVQFKCRTQALKFPGMHLSAAVWTVFELFNTFSATLPVQASVSKYWNFERDISWSICIHWVHVWVWCIRTLIQNYFLQEKKTVK